MNEIDRILEVQKDKIIVEDEQLTKSSRFNEAVWYKEAKKYSCTVGGVGNIGSWLCLYLGRNGIAYTAIDMDKIEIQNIGGQLYPKSDIGNHKVVSLRNTLRYFDAFNSYTDSIATYKITEYISINFRTENHILYSAFDNMEARKSMFSLFLNTRGARILIDGRSQAEYYQILVVDKDKPESIARYKEEYLFDDSEAEDAPCNYRSTTHCGSQLATMMVALTTNYITNISIGEEINRVPFFTQVNLRNFDLITEDA